MTKNFDLGQHIHRSAVNVMDFGAKGDGVTNDTAALQAAIAAAYGTGARKVVLPQGVYVTGPLTLPDWMHLEGVAYQPGIGGFAPGNESTRRAVELRFNLAAGVGLTCGLNPLIENIVFQNTAGSYNDGTATLSGQTATAIKATENITLDKCQFITWQNCIVTGLSTYYAKLFRFHINRCTNGIVADEASPYNIDIHAPHATMVNNFITGLGAFYARNIKIHGGSIENYQTIANHFIDFSAFGTYFETNTAHTGVFAIDPATNGANVALFGCLAYMVKTARFINMSSLTACSLTSHGNILGAGGPAAGIYAYLPASGNVSMGGDSFGAGHNAAFLYVDSIGHAVEFNGITLPVLPAGNPHVSFSGQTLIGKRGFNSVGLAAAPVSPNAGMTVMADGDAWDPLARAAGRPYWTVWQGDRWRSPGGGV